MKKWSKRNRVYWSHKINCGVTSESGSEDKVVVCFSFCRVNAVEELKS